jgi:threonine dehydrogenase-like Zn-dependent dehydrogenase
MKAAVVPAVSSSWQIKDVPQPQPGPNQVLVKMHASGICYTDVHETLGHLPGSFPRILGHEPVGEIVWLLMSRRGKWATAWAVPGFNPRAGAANGASVAAECSVPI